MSIIEQAVRRLEQLRRSGIEPPGASSKALPDVHRDGPGDANVFLRREVKEGAQPTAEFSPLERDLKAASHPSNDAKSSRLVRIDLDRLGEMGYITPNVARTRIADEFRVIKRPLLANLQGGGASEERSNLVMVTSSLPGEGKTFVSVNLALSLAMELDKTALLVDADVSRPSVLDRLGLPQTRGLLDLLTDRTLCLADVLLRTNVPRLSLLPAGRPREQATELLSSEGMRRLLAELASRYADRILVFDAPPLLPSTESRVLATQMGKVILVVEANRTSQQAVEEALATLEQCPHVWSLLNKIGRSEVGSYHGYYHPVDS